MTNVLSNSVLVFEALVGNVIEGRNPELRMPSKKQTRLSRIANTIILL